MTRPFPHAGEVRAIPAPNSPGSFGAVRKHDVHTGIDLYCAARTRVLAVEAGTVVAILDFTGPDSDPPSPWWNPTMAVLIEGQDHVLCYGEVLPRNISVGDQVEPGQVIGTVLQVLKEYKGRPVSMLHFEMYERGTRDPVWWQKGEPKPAPLLDPTKFILDLLGAP